MIILNKPRRTKYIHALVFGPPSSASKFVLTFPSIVAVDANGSLEDFVGSKEDIRILHTTKATEVNELLECVLSGKERAGSFVLNGLSRIQNEIEFMTSEGFGRFKPAVRHRLCEMTDRVRSLPMHTIMTVRDIEDRARVGEVVAGRLVGAEDRPVIGMTYDIDPEVPYSCNLTIEMIPNGRGGYNAKIISSHVYGINMDDVIEDPSFAKLLEMTGMKAEASQKIASLESVPPSRLQESKIIVATTVAETPEVKGDNLVVPPGNDAPSGTVEPVATTSVIVATGDQPKITLVNTDADLIGIAPNHSEYSSNKHLSALVRRLNDLKTAIDKNYVRKPTQDYVSDWGYKLDGPKIPLEVRYVVIPKFDAAIVGAIAELAAMPTGLKPEHQEVSVAIVPPTGVTSDSGFGDETKNDVAETPSSKFGDPSHRSNTIETSTPNEKFGEPSHRVDRIPETVAVTSDANPFDDMEEVPNERIVAVVEDATVIANEVSIESAVEAKMDETVSPTEIATQAATPTVKLITKSQTGKILERKDSYHVTDEDFVKILTDVAPGISLDDLAPMTHGQANDVLAKLARLKPSEEAA